MKTKKIVRINRARWLRQGRFLTVDSLLYDEDCNSMCCLGFVANQYSRISKKRLQGHGSPEAVYKGESILTNANECGDIFDNDLATRAIIINDDSYTSDAKKERELKKLFKKDGRIELEFYGERCPSYE